MCEIGERGINLSGGQKQRISLARAIYAKKDIYLLDDPLSAVDQHVGKAIFEKCIMGLLKKRLVLFVTNQLQYLGECDSVLFLKNGEMSGYGNLKHLLNVNPDFALLMREFVNTGEQEDVEDINLEKPKKNVSQGNEIKKENDKEDGGLVVEEVQLIGNVSWHHYLCYAKNGGGLNALGVLGLTWLGVGLRTGYDYFLSFWVDSLEFGTSVHFNSWYIGILSGIVCSFVLVIVLRSFMMIQFCLTSSTRAHNLTFKKLLQAPMSFFDVTPLGRILNRFSNDMNKLDTELPLVLEDLLHFFHSIFATILIIALSMPWFVLVAIPVVAAFFHLITYFVKSSRELKRIDAMSVSPVVSHISTTLQGLSSIRLISSFIFFFFWNMTVFEN
eukprot:TRINITY_DN10405_c0_g1_i1.p1 TRINITY_DN10405_c0_g1~~TRINITY_DN10405_c0_g1_i1.p1  ORF type:complete len:386 (-),score=80.72 TRINITY_DN10405_c0_g1_i1:8-1165(-)